MNSNRHFLDTRNDPETSKQLIYSEDNIYFDILLTNTSNNLIEASYDVTKKGPILKQPRDYYLALSKFTCDLSALPIFRFRDGEYVITSKWDVFTENTIVPFISTTPSNPSNRDIYNYQHFLNIINSAIRTSLSNLWTTSGGTLPVPNPTVATNPVPFIAFDGENSPLRFVFPEEYNNDIVANTVELFFNYSLFEFFETFQSEFNGDFSSNEAFKIIVRSDGENYANYPTDGIVIAFDGYTMVQDSSSFYLWYDIKDILISSQSLPVLKENYGFPNSLSNDNTKLSILTDVSITSLGGVGTLGTLEYLPQPQYRLLTLTSSQVLSQVDIRFNYRTKRNEIRPLLLAPNKSITCKLLFVKRDLFKN